MEKFRIALVINNLFDVKGVDDSFTWSNKHGNRSFTKERLDKLVNCRWKTIFTKIKVVFEPIIIFDHKPLMICMKN